MKVYGEAMVTKVLAFVAQWEALLPKIEEWAERIDEEFAPYQSEKEAQLEAERQRKEQRERERQEREERQRREAEEAAKKAAEEAARKQAERLEELRLEKEKAERAARLEREREEERRNDLSTYLAQNTASQVLLDSVRMLQSAMGPNKSLFETTLKAVHGVISNVVSYPDEEQFKTIRKSNPRFHSDVGQHPGAIGCLFAVGMGLNFFCAYHGIHIASLRKVVVLGALHDLTHLCISPPKHDNTYVESHAQVARTWWNGGHGVWFGYIDLMCRYLQILAMQCVSTVKIPECIMNMYSFCPGRGENLFGAAHPLAMMRRSWDGGRSARHLSRFPHAKTCMLVVISPTPSGAGFPHFTQLDLGGGGLSARQAANRSAMIR